MDTLRAGTYTDVPDNLEKGCPEVQPLHPETCHTCSSQHTRTRGRRSFVKHPWVVFSILALMWLVFSHGKHAFGRLHQAWRHADDRGEFSLTADEDPDRCVYSANWTTYYDRPPEYPYGAEATLSLPLDSDVLYLFSRGPYQQGLVSIEQSTQVGDAVDVRIRAYYYDDEALERVTVCHMKRAEREDGVGIFTRWWRRYPPSHPKGQIRFDVTVTLPAGDGAPLSVKKLETRLPNYNQNVADLQESAYFDKITLTSANGRLSVQSITSESGEFSSLNGDIDGHFNARSSLGLHTTNGHITPTVNLLHREGAEPSNLAMHTINGMIDAEISLASQELIGSEFEVDAKSVNGGIGLKFTHSPLNAILRCLAETVRGGIEVELDSAFEGGYSLQSITGKKVVSEQDVEDPAGKGRHRVITQNGLVGQVAGEIKWVESDGSSSGDEGFVALKAVVSSVKLVV